MSDQIVTVCINNERHRDIVEFLSSYDRARRITKVPYICQQMIAEGYEISERDIRSFMEEMQGLGHGRLVLGRRGKQTRFEWAGSFLEALDPVFKALELESSVVEESSDEEDAEPDLIEHSLRLREDFTATLLLPSDVTPTEARRLAALVTAIPISQD